MQTATATVNNLQHARRLSEYFIVAGMDYTFTSGEGFTFTVQEIPQDIVNAFVRDSANVAVAPSGPTANPNLNTWMGNVL